MATPTTFDIVQQTMEGMSDSPETVETTSVDAPETAETLETEAASPETATVEETGETPPAPAEAPAPTTQTASADTVAAPKEDEVTLRALEAELLAKNPNLRKGRIPAARHQAILTRQRRLHEAQVKEFEVARAQATEYTSEEVQNRLRAASLFEHNPEVAVRQVLMHDPRYRAVFEALARELVPPAPATPPPAKSDEPAEPPKPDVLLADGTVGYSAEATKRLLAYQLQQERQTAAQDRQALEARVKAFEDQFKPFAERQAIDARLGESMTRMKALVDDARRTWPGFTDHEPAIRAELNKPGNERLTLDAAYRRVVVPNLSTSREQIEAEVRAKVLAELSKAKPASGRPSSPEFRDDAASGMSTEQIVRASLRQLEAAT